MSTAARIETASTELSPNWARPLHVSCKRILDIAGATTLLIVLSPLLLMLVVLTKLTSPGPLLYRWRVVGKKGRFFTSYKFRSMAVGADRLKASLAKHNEMAGPVFKMSADPRVTPVGRWMRQYSLDELPQLYSVLKGDMSLVGPRPPLQEEYLKFSEHQKLKLLVTPGMTCLWQVGGRNNVRDFDEWVRLDLEYIRRWSLWLDCQILSRTVGVVLAGSGK
jgi:lipopolysaccharide/colanic/teichoic acid biosynthesis glycosyltransferase